ncbi:MAG TPA: hypothetical protein PJ982_07820 [Lacipirellulaceae bacterium]|nr:hypothetical protein [Lacipirellulaceae bacterium]
MALGRRLAPPKVQAFKLKAWRIRRNLFKDNALAIQLKQALDFVDTGAYKVKRLIETFA